MVSPVLPTGKTIDKINCTASMTNPYHHGLTFIKISIMSTMSAIQHKNETKVMIGGITWFNPFHELETLCMKKVNNSARIKNQKRPMENKSLIIELGFVSYTPQAPIEKKKKKSVEHFVYLYRGSGRPLSK